MICLKQHRNRNKRVRLTCLTLFSVLFCSPLSAQNDSILYQPAKKTIASSDKKMETKEHSANRALILSAVLPGAGQVYNHQAWKVPIVYAALGGMAYYSYYNYKQMRSYKDEYLYRVNHFDSPSDPDLATTPTSNIYNLYETYNKSFQLSIIISVAVYGLNLLDAYVFGHLFDFQISDDLSLNVAPVWGTTPHNVIGKEWNQTGISLLPMASITLRF